MPHLNLNEGNRVTPIQEVMNVLRKVVREGDKIRCGLEDDPLRPKQYREGTVLNVEKEGTEKAEVTVEWGDGSEEKLSPTDIGPDKIWEFTDESQADVMKRCEAKVKKSNQKYRGSMNASESDEVVNLRAELKKNREDQEAFNAAVCHAIARVASGDKEFNADLCRAAETANYRGTCSTRASPYDSDGGSDHE